MPNYCDFTLVVKGKKENCEKLKRALKAEYMYYSEKDLEIGVPWINNIDKYEYKYISTSTFTNLFLDKNYLLFEK